VKSSSFVGLAEGVKARLNLTVFWIGQHKERGIEKHLLCFSHRYPVPLILSGVTFVPFETNDFREIDHFCIL